MSTFSKVLDSIVKSPRDGCLCVFNFKIYTSIREQESTQATWMPEHWSNFTCPITLSSVNAGMIPRVSAGVAGVAAEAPANLSPDPRFDPEET